MLLRTVLGVFALLLVCAGSAQASSLVYIKDSNVWLANAGRERGAPVDDGWL